jgi:hypothetical protein
MTVSGKLVKDDFGTGVWVLETDSGERLMLDGAVPEGLEGKRVSVDGSKSNAMGMGMSGGGVISVRSIKRA